MKRLALAAAAVIATAMAPAQADDQPTRFRQGDSWCERHAATMVDVEVAEGVGLVVGGGTYLGKPVTSAYSCYDVTVAGERRGDLASAWVDSENGVVGLTCVKQSSPKPPGCKRTPVELPVEGATPLSHPGKPWWLHLLGVEIDYAVVDGGGDVAVRAAQCLPDSGVGEASLCGAVPEQRVSARPDVRYRARGYECDARGGGTCTRTEQGTDARAPEDDGAPTLAVNTVAVDAPVVCIEIDVDPRC